MNKLNTIEIYDINPSKIGYVAEYSTENGVEVTLDIDRDILLDYIHDMGMTLIETQIAEDNFIENRLDRDTVLYDNYFEIIKGYLETL